MTQGKRSALVQPAVDTMSDFDALNEAYDSELAHTSDVFFRLVLQKATGLNHIQLIKRMLTHPMCELNETKSFLISPDVYNKGRAKGLRNYLRIMGDFIRAQKKLKEGAAWSFLMSKVRSDFDAADILADFDDAYEMSSEFDYAMSVVHLQHAAMDNHHVELFRLLCSAKNGKLLRSYSIAIEPPLYMALRKRNLLLADMYLRAGSRLTFTFRYFEGFDLAKKSKIETLGVQSAVEYACCLDDVGMLRLLLAFDTKENPERGMALHISCHHCAVNCIRYLLSTVEGRAAVNVFRDFLCNTELSKPVMDTFRITAAERVLGFRKDDQTLSPLHVLLNKIFIVRAADRLLQLLTAVRHLIEAGVRVNDRDARGQTPLHNFINEIVDMTREQRDLSREERQAYVETVRILLEAGTSLAGPISVHVLDVLLPKSLLDNAEQLKSFISYICSCKEALQLRADLLELLLAHGAETAAILRDFTYYAIMLELVGELSRVVYTPERLETLSVDAPWCHILIDKLRTMLRCSLLAGSLEHNNDDRPFLLEPRSINSLISLVAYSHKSGRKRFLRLVEYALTDWKINEVKRHLLSTLEAMLNNTEDVCDADLKTTIEFASAIKAPLCLQDLARREINRAMAYRGLLVSPSLGISVHQEDYVLLRE